MSRIRYNPYNSYGIQPVSRPRLSAPSSKPCTCLEDTGSGQLAATVLGRNRHIQRLSNWLGWGDYSVSSNSLISGGGSTSTMRLVSEGAREVRINFKEYVGDVFTHPTEAGAFYQQNYALNPGIVDLFPWLSAIAQEYQQWKPLGMVFEFVSTSGDITDNQALGKIIMATDYNTTTLQTSFANAQEMLSEAYSNEAKPTANIIHGIECAPKERAREVYFVRAGGAPTGTNLGDFDLGQFTIATVGGPTANTNLGSLYIHYDLVFYKQTLTQGVQNKNMLIRAWRGTTGISTTVPLGTNVALVANTGLYGGGSPRVGVPGEDFTLAQGTGLKITFPRWAAVGSMWQLLLTGTGGSASADYNTSAWTLVGLTDIQTAQGPPDATATTSFAIRKVYRVDANTALAPPSITINPDVVLTTSAVLTIHSMPNWWILST